MGLSKGGLGISPPQFWVGSGLGEGPHLHTRSSGGSWGGPGWAGEGLGGRGGSVSHSSSSSPSPFLNPSPFTPFLLNPFHFYPSPTLNSPRGSLGRVQNLWGGGGGGAVRGAWHRENRVRFYMKRGRGLTVGGTCRRGEEAERRTGGVARARGVARAGSGHAPREPDLQRAPGGGWGGGGGSRAGPRPHPLCPDMGRGRGLTGDGGQGPLGGGASGGSERQGGGR